MSTACYDRSPEPPRDPIRIAGELVRRGDKLSIEAANAIKRLEHLATDHYTKLTEWQERTGYSCPSLASQRIGTVAHLEQILSRVEKSHKAQCEKLIRFNAIISDLREYLDELEAAEDTSDDAD